MCWTLAKAQALYKQVRLGMRNQVVLDYDRSESEHCLAERTNPSINASTMEYLQTVVFLMQKAALQADKILPKYMFSNDIKEFKNTKITKYVKRCEEHLKAFKQRSKLLGD